CETLRRNKRGSDWRRSRRAHRTVLWVVRALCRPSDRGDRGRTHWRETNHKSWPCGLGHISGWSGRRHCETFYRAHHDRDLSDERAIAVIRGAHLSVMPGDGRGSRGVTLKLHYGTLDCVGMTKIFCCQLLSFVLQSYFD